MAQALGRYTHITTNTTTTCRSGMGMLLFVSINIKGTGGNTATLYDSLTGSGTVIAVIDTTSAMGSILYEVLLQNGLTIVTANGVAADLTVVTD